MDNSTQWWLMAGVLIAVELTTGTFYLLMLALGAVAGALAAHAGLGVTTQLILSGLVGGFSAGGWYALKRQRLQRQLQAGPLGRQDAPDLSLDLGQTVTVTTWLSDGTTQVSYRGATWSARLKDAPLAHGPVPEPGLYRIGAMQGNQLLLEKL